MKSRNIPVITIAASLAALGGMARGAQDKYAVQVPNGLALSECRGYDDWPGVAVSQPEDRLNVIVANPVMIDAYWAGVPGNGMHFPDGSKIAKIAWKTKQESSGPICRAGAGHPGRGWLHGEGQQQIQGHRRMGLRPV